MGEGREDPVPEEGAGASPESWSAGRPVGQNEIEDESLQPPASGQIKAEKQEGAFLISKRTGGQADRRIARFYVYVVELDTHPRARSGLADRPTGRLADLYVGSSVMTPHARLEKHLAGGPRASRHVRDHGIKLRPDLYEGLNPIRSREAARRVEQDLATRLERRGFRVFGACRMGRERGCVM